MDATSTSLRQGFGWQAILPAEALCFMRRLGAEADGLSAEARSAKAEARGRLAKADTSHFAPAFAKAPAGKLFRRRLRLASSQNFFVMHFLEGSMKYVYLLQSLTYPEQRYTGLTNDIDKRLAAHNAGQSPHTSKFRPWKLVGYLALMDESKVAAFEKYLKSGSGRAFSNKHFW